MDNNILNWQKKVNNWKEKAKERRITNWDLRKRIEELKRSRSLWKEKYNSLQGENQILRQELKKLEQGGRGKIKHHKYSVEEVSFFIHLRILACCSLRGCIKVLRVLALLFELEFREPSPSSIRIWEIKLGIEKVGRRPNDEKDEWALIIDESVNIGNQKILLVLGVNLKAYDFCAPLTLSDVEVLEVRVRKSWKSEEIVPVIASVYERKYNIKYCCSDNGNNLCKSLRTKDIVHIEDCGHCLGKILERRYKKDAEYKAFSKVKNLFSKQNVLSKYAAFLPPKDRSKGRFMNLWPTCEWAKKILSIAREYKDKKDKRDIFEKIEWIIGYENLIMKLHTEQALINQINKILKTQGLSHQSINICNEEIEKSNAQEGFSNQIKEYLNRNIAKLPEQPIILCSSDIIESIFGNYKYRQGNSIWAGLTEGCLTMANYGKNYSHSQVKNAMEETKMIDILNWRKENLPESLLQKKKQLFKNTG